VIPTAESAQLTVPVRLLSGTQNRSLPHGRPVIEVVGEAQLDVESGGRSYIVSRLMSTLHRIGTHHDN